MTQQEYHRISSMLCPDCLEKFTKEEDSQEEQN
jgi:hypothetical protein